MNEKQFRDALLKLGAPASGDARLQTWKVLERDRRRVRFLAVLTVLLWLAAAVISGLVIYMYAVEFLPQVPQLLRDFGNQQVGRDEITLRNFHLGLIVSKGLFVVAASVASLTLATMGTFLLIFASRRATLRQINAHLMAITEELQRLRAPPPG